MSKSESQTIGTEFRRTSQEVRSAESKKDRVLGLLMQSGRWVSSSELQDVTHRFSASLNTLRNEGHVIDRRRDDQGESQWRYIKSVPMVKVTGDWKRGYYDSPHWKHTSYLRRKHDSYLCCNCKSPRDLQVHHWCYDLFEEDIEDLMTLCNECHERIHSHIPIAFPFVVTPEVFGRLHEPVAAMATPHREQASLF